MEVRPIEGRHRDGGSTYQSFARGATSAEVDWLNGEIVLLGRQLGIPTPVNQMLCDMTRQALAQRAAPRSIPAVTLLDQI
jgi:2-dehydropantoate 2-reductase